MGGGARAGRGPQNAWGARLARVAAVLRPGAPQPHTRTRNSSFSFVKPSRSGFCFLGSATSLFCGCGGVGGRAPRDGPMGCEGVCPRPPGLAPPRPGPALAGPAPPQQQARRIWSRAGSATPNPPQTCGGGASRTLVVPLNTAHCGASTARRPAGRARRMARMDAPVCAAIAGLRRPAALVLLARSMVVCEGARGVEAMVSKLKVDCVRKYLSECLGSAAATLSCVHSSTAQHSPCCTRAPRPAHS